MSEEVIISESNIEPEQQYKHEEKFEPDKNLESSEKLELMENPDSVEKVESEEKLQSERKNSDSENIVDLEGKLETKEILTLDEKSEPVEKSNSEGENESKENLESEKILKQPWLGEEERFRGKERYTDFCLYNKENSDQTLHFDRKDLGKSTLEETNSSDFNWSKYKKEVLASSDTDLLFNVLADLRSHTLVALGEDRLSNETALQHLKTYKDYLKKKEERITASVEKFLKEVDRKKAQKSRKKIEFVKDKIQTTLPEEVITTPQTPPKTAPKTPPKNAPKTPPKGKVLKEETVAMDCPLCKRAFDDVNEHLLMVHYKTRILDDYPCSNFKCFFSGCSFVTIPRSVNYVRHIGLQHKILESLLKETSIQSPSKLKMEDVNFRFKCPFCPIKQVSDPMIHLSRHFTEQVKEDFPFIKEDNGYICPIAECSELPMSMQKLVQHINIDHQQINTYLKDANLDHLGQTLSKKKRKLSMSSIDADCDDYGEGTSNEKKIKVA